MARQEVIDAPLASIADEAKRISAQIPGTTWYLFGSMLTNSDFANDIDLLVTHDSAGDGPSLRQELASLCVALPLHLMIMSEAEAQELNVRGRYRLRQLFPPA